MSEVIRFSSMMGTSGPTEWSSRISLMHLSLTEHKSFMRKFSHFKMGVLQQNHIKNVRDTGFYETLIRDFHPCKVELSIVLLKR